MKHYRVTQAADLIGVSASTLRRYTEEGRIMSSRNPAGQRTYTQVDINAFLGTNPSEPIIVFYVRSSDGDTVKMDNQVKSLTQVHGEPTRVFKDKASGLSEKRQGLQSLLNNAEKGNFNTLAVTQKDRLTRFGYTYLERLLATYGVTIVVLGEKEPKTGAEELLQDFMSLLASFSGKLYRMRGWKQQQELLAKAGEVLAEKQPTD